MSLITRCPECETLFRVVPDQLRISEGWVRCGHCASVFDAAAHMATAEKPSQDYSAGVSDDVSGIRSDIPPGTAAEIASDEGATVPAELSDPQTRVSERPGPPDEPGLVAGWLNAASEQPVIAADDGTEPVSALRLPPSDVDASLAGTVVDEPASEPGVVDAAQWTREGTEQTSTLDAPADAPPAPDVGFIRQARRAALWRRPLVRVVVGLLGLGFTVLLAAQVALHERDRLAALDARLLPALEWLCRPLGCSVGPLRRIDALVVEASAFNKLRNGDFRLSLTLRNAASLPVAPPAIELTLTDERDEAILRRVIQPDEAGWSDASLDPGADKALVMVMHLDAAAGLDPARVVGYRVLAFYP